MIHLNELVNKKWDHCRLILRTDAMIQLNVTFLFSEIYLGNIATFIIFKIWNKIEITETVSEMVYTEDYLKEKLTKELEAEVCEVTNFII